MIVRQLLRDEVHKSLIEMLLHRELLPGENIAEQAVASRLGVSRTPLREALLRLEKEGFLYRDPSRGFFVADLTTTEVEEIYPVLWTLEILALRLEGRLGANTLARLSEITSEISNTSREQVQRLLELDSKWHQTLVSKCNNSWLRGFIDNLRQAARRYEYAYLLEAGSVVDSVEHHRGILEALTAGDLERAETLLRDHWRFGMERVLTWLTVTSPTKGDPLTGRID
jgi:DNA-binding GntR family transcriptional regulator